MAEAVLRAGRRANGESGAVLIEFAFALPLLLLLILGMFDFGFAFQRYEVLTNAAREGARVAVLPGYGTADVQNRVAAYLTAGGVPDTPTTTVDAVVVSPCAGCAPFNAVAVTVKVNYTFSLVSPIATIFGSSFGTLSLTAKSVMRSEIAAGGD
jgi:Flp pilus assembly protein TadG